MDNVVLTPKLWVPTPAAELLMPDLPKWAKDQLGRILLMAGSKSNYLSQKLSDHALGATAFTSPTNTYYGLWTSALDDTSNGGTVGESTYGSYARVLQANNTTNYPAGTGTTTYTKTNANALNFATSTSGTSVITYLGIFDGNAGTSADNLLYWASVTSTTINSGDTPKINASGVTIVED